MLFSRRLLSAVLVVLLIGVRGATITAGDRRSTPTELEQKEVRKGFRDRYRRELRSRDSVVRRRLASKLIAESKAVQPGSVEQYVHLTEAIALAEKARDLRSLSSALDLLGNSFEIDVLTRKLDAYDSIARGMRSAADAATMTQELLGILGLAVKVDDFPTATRAAKSAVSLSRKSRDKELQRLAKQELGQVAIVEKEFERIQPQAAALLADETDAAANLAIGRYVALFKGDWDVGLPLLARSGEPGLVDLAKADRSDPSEADLQIVVAKGWLDYAIAAEGPPRTLSAKRSIEWYAKGVHSLERLGALRHEIARGLRSEVLEVTKLAGGNDLASSALVLLTFDHDHRNGATVRDLGPRGNHGMAQEVGEVSGQIGEALRFDGEGHVDLSSIHDELMSDLRGLTLSTWIRSDFRSEDKAVVFDVGDFSVRSVSLYEKEVWRFRVTGGDNRRVKSRTRIDSRWHHVVGTWDGSEQRIFIDGQLEGTMGTGSLVLDRDYLGSASPRIGSRARHSGLDRMAFHGLLDDFALFPRALSAAEIRAIYMRGLLGISLADR